MAGILFGVACHVRTTWRARPSPRCSEGCPVRGGCPALLQRLLHLWCNEEQAPKRILAPSSWDSAWQVGVQPYQGFWGSTSWLSALNYHPKPPPTALATSPNTVLKCYWFSPAEAENPAPACEELLGGEDHLVTGCCSLKTHHCAPAQAEMTFQLQIPCFTLL